MGTSPGALWGEGRAWQFRGLWGTPCKGEDARAGDALREGSGVDFKNQLPQRPESGDSKGPWPTMSQHC
jgi:hypothetical protein